MTIVQTYAAVDAPASGSAELSSGLPDGHYRAQVRGGNVLYAHATAAPSDLDDCLLARPTQQIEFNKGSGFLAVWVRRAVSGPLRAWFRRGWAENPCALSWELYRKVPKRPRPPQVTMGAREVDRVTVSAPISSDFLSEFLSLRSCLGLGQLMQYPVRR